MAELYMKIACWESVDETAGNTTIHDSRFCDSLPWVKPAYERRLLQIEDKMEWATAGRL